MKLSFDPTLGQLRINFAYNRFLVEAIKELPVRSYNPNSKDWVIGFDSSSLSSILAMLAGHNWPPDQLNTAEAQARAYLTTKEPSIDQKASQTAEFETTIKPLIPKIGTILESALIAGTLDHAEYGEMIRLLNHISLKDFIR